MTRFIPIKLAEQAMKVREDEIKQLKEQLLRIKKAGDPLFEWFCSTTDCECEECDKIKSDWESSIKWNPNK